MNTEKTRVESYEGQPLICNWGSFDVFGVSGKAVVVEWRTGKAVERFDGPNAAEEADRHGERLHWIHDIMNG